jgi:hypothetical protein
VLATALPPLIAGPGKAAWVVDFRISEPPPEL